MTLRTAQKRPESRQKSKKMINLKSPGPATYQANYKKVIKSHSGYSIGRAAKSETAFKHMLKNPSPAQYESSCSSQRPRSAVTHFGHERKNKSTQFVSPGPGQYSKADRLLLSKKNPQIQFSKAERLKSSNFIIPGRKQQIQIANAYEISNEFDNMIKKKKGFSIASQNITRSQSELNPGPADYNTNRKFKQTCVKFTTARRKTIDIVNNPGPGSYIKLNTKIKGMSFTRDANRGIGINKFMPGPTDYESVDIKRSIPKYSLPKSKRMSQSSIVTPGPSDYQPKEKESQKYKSMKINTAKRRTQQNKFSPGPGYYDLKDESRKSSKKYSIAHTSKFAEASYITPGPGDYNINDLVTSKRLKK